MTNIRPDGDSCMKYYMIHNVSLDMKGCIWHSVNRQMHPLISKGAIYRSSWVAYRYVSMSTFMTISVTVGIDWPLWARYCSCMMRYHTRVQCFIYDLEGAWRHRSSGAPYHARRAPRWLGWAFPTPPPQLRVQTKSVKTSPVITTIYTSRYQVLCHRCERETSVIGVFSTVKMAWLD